MKTFLCIALFTVAVSALTQQSTNQFVNDNNVLNYALTLENFENALYQQGIAYFGASDANYTAAGFPVGTYNVLAAIARQENNHAVTLSATLKARGWPAVAPCTYNFNFPAVPNVLAFLTLLSQVEHIGTQAYDGAARALTNKYLLTTAASIATVEARHTATLQYILQANPFGGGDGGNFTIPINETSAFNAISGYIVTCPSVNQTVGYLNNTLINVNSAIPATYLWKTAAVVRGANPALTSLDTFENDANGLFYWGAPNGANLTNLFSDAKVLNYALTLEHLEATFYQQFTSSYTVAAIQAAFPSVTTAEAGMINQYISLIALHEATHVQFLQDALTRVATTFSVTPAQFNISTACSSYNWTALAGIASVPALDPATANFATFLSTSVVLESTGVSAYAGAISSITNSYLTTVAATIATVEAEHTAYLTQLNQGDVIVSLRNATSAAFPNDMDTTKNILDVLGLLTGQTGGNAVIGSTCAQQLSGNLPTSNGPANFYRDGGDGSPTDAQSQPALNNGTITTGTTTGTTNSGSGTTNSGTTGNSGDAASMMVSAAVVFAAAVLVL